MECPAAKEADQKGDENHEGASNLDFGDEEVHLDGLHVHSDEDGEKDDQRDGGAKFDFSFKIHNVNFAKLLMKVIY